MTTDTICQRVDELILAERGVTINKVTAEVCCRHIAIQKIATDLGYKEHMWTMDTSTVKERFEGAKSVNWVQHWLKCIQDEDYIKKYPCIDKELLYKHAEFQ